MNKVNKASTAVKIVPHAAPLSGGDAALARYMSELGNYDLLSRDGEIELAQAVERLEVAYWEALLASPRAFALLRPILLAGLEQPLTEIAAVARLAPQGARSKAPRAVLGRYQRAVAKLAAKLRELDIHRTLVAEVHAALRLWCGQGDVLAAPNAARPTKTMLRVLSDADTARHAQQAAKDRFVSANLRLVVSMARRYARTERMPLGDLIQEGNIGLMKAVERFDYRRGFRFSTYASWWIRHALTRGLADKGRLVRLPVHALEARARIARVARKLTSATGMRPTALELAKETGLSLEKVVAAEALSTESHLSLDASVGNDTDRTFLDLLPDKDDTNAEERIVEDGRKQDVAHLLGDLSPFEAQILRYRYGFDGAEERTLKEIGDMYNLSRERIRQIQAGALAKMRDRLERSESDYATH